MKRILICLLLIALLLPASTAFAKREVRMDEYNTAKEFRADIELKTKVSFDAYLITTRPYENERTFCLSCPLLPQGIEQYGVTICIYVTQEDLDHISASSINDKEDIKYVHVTGEVTESPVESSIYVDTMNGKGSIEPFVPEYKIYHVEDLSDIDSFKRNAVNYLDRIEILDGVVISTDDTKTLTSQYGVRVLCGDKQFGFYTTEKEFFIEDHICGIGTFRGIMDGYEIMLCDPEFSLQ